MHQPRGGTKQKPHEHGNSSLKKRVKMFLKCVTNRNTR